VRRPRPVLMYVVVFNKFALTFFGN
jgi:hypothetical protein